MKKALIAVGLVLVFGLFTAAFSLAPAFAQYPPPSTGRSCGGNTSGNATSNSTSTANASDTEGTNATGGETLPMALSLL